MTARLVLDVVFVAATAFAALVATTFATRYARLLRWEDSAEGRSLMAASVATALLAWLYVINRVDELLDAQNWSAVTIPLRIVMWVALGCVYLWRLRVLCIVTNPRCRNCPARQEGAR